MSPASDKEMQRLLIVVAAARAWVGDVTDAGLHDWTTPIDNSLIDAVDAYEHPTAAGSDQRCLRDASLEQYGLLAGQYVCSRVADHSGSCRFRPWAELIAQIA